MENSDFMTNTSLLKLGWKDFFLGCTKFPGKKLPGAHVPASADWYLDLLCIPFISIISIIIWLYNYMSVNSLSTLKDQNSDFESIPLLDGGI